MKSQRSPILIPILLVGLGTVILLGNYFLIDLQLGGYWPVVLILIGIQVLVRGDLGMSWQAHSFGITRGGVESASIEANGGEIDIRLRALRRTGRLIAGQYTARSRPRLLIRDNHARLILKRGDTWMLSLADWELEIAPDLPWDMLLSTHLGEIDVDLRDVQIRQAHIASGIGDVKVICPNRYAGPLHVRSMFGDIQLTIPKNVPALIRVNSSRLANLSTRGEFHQHATQTNLYATTSYKEGQATLDITVSATFGTVVLIASS